MIFSPVVRITVTIRSTAVKNSAGRGIFARFAPWTLDHSTHYYDPPNFWHKASNLRVRWYKWIGRDMVVRNPNKADVAAVMRECVESVRKP